MENRISRRQSDDPPDASLSRRMGMAYTPASKYASCEKDTFPTRKAAQKQNAAARESKELLKLLQKPFKIQQSSDRRS